MNSAESNRFYFALRDGQLTLLLLICCLLAGSGCGDKNGKVDADRFSVLGKMMAEKTIELCKGNGDVVLAVSENDYEQPTPYGVAFDAFRKALGKTVPVNGTDVVKTPKVLGPGSEPLPAEKFAELLQKHSGAGYLVSFVRVPALTAGQIAQLPSPRPQVVAVIPNPQLAKVMFASKVLCLAAVAKLGAAEVATGGSAQEVFDAQYQLITPDTVGQLTR